MSKQPLDIILLVLDTQRADRLSCYGYEKETSPNLDRLATESTLFRNAVAAAQWTIPSHASMFTGVYPDIHQMVQSYSVLPSTLPTLAERLREGGYYTAAFCNNPLVGVINNGLRRGFYSFLNYSGLLTDRPNQAGIPANLIDRYRSWFKRVLAGTFGKVQDAFARSDALLSLSFNPLMVPLWQTALSFKGNTAKSLEDAAKLLIDRQQTEGQPIFTFINLMEAHMPYHPPRRFVERFAPHVLKDKDAQGYLRQFNSDVYGWLAPLADPLNARHKETLDGMYDAEVAAQDEQVGRFVEQLRDRGVLDNALLVICADHGEHLGEKRLLGHTNAIYNELARVPLIVRDASNAFPRSTIREEVVSTRQLFHSILTSAGCATEAEMPLTLALTGETQPVFAMAIPPQNVLNLLMQRQPELVRERQCDRASLAVWSQEYKLLAKGGEGDFLDSCELYNIVSDPTETLDLRDIMPEQTEMLQDYLEDFYQQKSPVAVCDRPDNFDDPQVYQRLKDLGYLE
ncbi:MULTISPECIES: sulfatase [Spirulina sp. CCY15215]|uniref:sulfatase n=1 Tax=Spirulina sp. CCY15215 TaxID=2767591 RepID=UPI00194F62BD|nr:sulfatase [Spirulina major]